MVPETEFHFLQPVEEVPSVRRRKPSVYDEIIREFIKSNLKCAEVKNVKKSPQTIYFMLTLRLKKMQLENVKVRLRSGKVYLEKVELQNAKHDNRQILKPTAITDFPGGYSDGKPIIDVIHLLNTYIIKLKCPKCKALNSKEARSCRECNYNFYRDEKEYRSSLELIEKLERKINSKEGMRQNSTQI